MNAGDHREPDLMYVSDSVVRNCSNAVLLKELLYRYSKDPASFTRETERLARRLDEMLNPGPIRR